jgi:hypothetical protein
MTNTIKDVQSAISNLVDLFKSLNWGDPFASGRCREAILASFLGHNIAADLHGADAYDDNGDIFEYKTTTVSKGISGRYDVSSQPTWEELVDYLREEKIANHTYHYYATFTPNMEIVSVYEMEGNTVLELILPKLHRKFIQEKTNLKVPSLYATLSAKEIRTHGNKLK